jgi:hypothetical protein
MAKFSPRANIEFAIDVREVSFNGADADVEIAGNLRIVLSLSGESRHFHLTGRKIIPLPLPLRGWARGSFVDDMHTEGLGSVT